MRKPRAIAPGDTIGIVSPSGPISAASLERGVELLKARGYRVVVGDHALDTLPGLAYLAGTDADRARDLERMFAREDIDAVLCSRGGYGAMRIVPHIDWERLASFPKIFCGYSDITTLHTVIGRTAQLITFHGPMASTIHGLDAAAAAQFWRMLEDPTPPGVLPTGDVPIETLVGGTAEGRLAGGCLCLLAQAVGSHYGPDLRGRIVLLEDTNEAVYEADRDITQLLNAGILQHAAGFVIGTLSRWESHEGDPPRSTPDALWRNLLAPLGKPTITGFPFGHVANPLTLPLGARVRLDADAKTLAVVESVLSPR